MPTLQVNVSLPSGSDRIRLDRYLSTLPLEGGKTVPRSQLKKYQITAVLFSQEESEKKTLKFSHFIQDGDILTIHWQKPFSRDPAEPVPIELDLIYEDANVLVINKQQGLAVHESSSSTDPNLVHALLYRYKNFALNFSAESNSPFFRPGIVHRLDKDTTGVLLVARDSSSQEKLTRQFAERRVKKTYLAVVQGGPPLRAGVIDLPLTRDRKNPQYYRVYKPPKTTRSGIPKQADPAVKIREARTHYAILKSWQNYSLVRLEPETGRTHQLRVHLRHLGCPVSGDPIYGRNDPNNQQLMLHAFKIQFAHPVTERIIRFTAPLPSHMREMIKTLSSIKGRD